MGKSKIQYLVLMPTSIALLASCAINPKTGNLGLAPSVQKSISSLGHGINDIYNNPDPCSNNARNLGITLGALAGAVIGHSQSNNKEGTIIGAALGATIGGAIGHNVDNRRCELYKIAKANDLSMASKSITDQSLTQADQTNAKASEIGLNVIVKDDGNQFQSGSAALTQRGKQAFEQMARVYASDTKSKNASNRKILIIAHADEEENSVDAAKLSEKRAKEVAQLFAENGVNAKNIYYQGAGDSMPVADNNTNDGRADNRRIQIVDLPDTSDLQRYLQLRTVNPNNFKIAVKPKVVSKQTAQTEPAKKLSPTNQNYDFGGTPYDQTASQDLGGSPESSSFSFVSNANAADHVIVGSCLFDTPRNAGTVQNLATGADLDSIRNIADAIPGLHDQPIMGSINGHFILIVHPYASRDTGATPPEPTLEVFKDFATRKKNNPDYKRQVPVNVYRGKDATLYRMFVNGPMQCMDLVVNAKNPKIQGKIYYTSKGSEYLANNEMNLKTLALK